MPISKIPSILQYMIESNLLDNLPTDETAFEASALNTPISQVAPGSGQELGEFGLSDYDNSSVTTTTDFLPKTPTEATFDPRLAFEIALNQSPVEEVYIRYGMDSEAWWSVARSPAFRKAVIDHQEEISENGVSFRMKARIQAESYLKDVHLLIKHPLTPPSVKADMIKWTTKVADLEPRKDVEDTSVKFNLQINL